jgi:hypothetical protein
LTQGRKGARKRKAGRKEKQLHYFVADILRPTLCALRDKVKRHE